MIQTPVHLRSTLVAVAVALSACTPRSQCAATDGAWDECGAGAAPRCVDGMASLDFRPAICEPGCVCPVDAPIWAEDVGCVTALECGAL